MALTTALSLVFIQTNVLGICKERKLQAGSKKCGNSTHSAHLCFRFKKNKLRERIRVCGRTGT